MKRSKIFKQVNDHTTELYDKVTKLETEILTKLSVLKKSRSRHPLCQHLFLPLEPECPDYDPQTNYYDLFWKTFLMNEIKKNKIEAFNEQCSMLAQNIEWIERKFSKYERLVSYRNSGMQKLYGGEDGEKFVCRIEGCGKTYESLGALDLHHKIKHESQREDSYDQSSIFLKIGQGSHYKRKDKN